MPKSALSISLPFSAAYATLNRRDRKTSSVKEDVHRNVDLRAMRSNLEGLSAANLQPNALWISQLIDLWVNLVPTARSCDPLMSCSNIL